MKLNSMLKVFQAEHIFISCEQVHSLKRKKCHFLNNIIKEFYPASSDENRRRLFLLTNFNCQLPNNLYRLAVLPVPK